MALASVATPNVSLAQSYDYDPCRAAQHQAANNGAVTGGILGAVLGSAVAGRGSRFGGAVVGGTVGAVAGHEVGRSSVRCLAYPEGIPPRRHCRWVEQDADGGPRDFEVCRGGDGVWRPSGRG